MKALVNPTLSTKRIEAVDALRGFALLGVLFANIPFGGNPPIETPFDETIHFLYNFLISKKFITIFSMLFGFGFFIPIFFIMVGVEFNLVALLSSSQALLLVPVLLLVAVAVKFFPAITFRLNFPWRESFAAGTLLVARLS